MIRRTLRRKTTKNLTRGRIKRSRSKEKSISKLIKEADALFSAKVRRIGGGTTRTSTTVTDSVWLSDFDEIKETNKCFTCGAIYPIKKLHCGHYLSRYYKAARWDFDNARPQCMMCNLWKRGDPIVFRQNLIKEIGTERVLAVEAKRSVPLKLSREYLAQLIQSLQ